ncbi:MAG: hypothetical protein AB9834_03890 [Lentimicrobium sp.]
MNSNNQSNPVSPGRITISVSASGTTTLRIPREGFSFKGLFTLTVIFFWLLMIMIWTILLIQYNYIWAFISIPFWLLGIVTLRLSHKVVFSTQEILVNEKEMTIVKKEGSKTAHVNFMRNDIETIVHVEGAFKSPAGITRKGIFPAVISKGEAFGFGERCTKAEKQYLLETIKNIIRL